MKTKLEWNAVKILSGAMLVFSSSLMGQQSSLMGYWREPSGSVIHVASCANDVCATLVALSSAAPSRVDGKNPKPELRQRPLCGLRIGDGFHLTGPETAEGGLLYDPKSGKTYHGTMTAHGDGLDLRGYIGISIFGRTERWKRTPATSSCNAQ